VAANSGDHPQQARFCLSNEYPDAEPKRKCC